MTLQERLNYLMLLDVHKKRTYVLDMQVLVTEFISESERRWTQWDGRGSAMVAVAAPCSFCENAMETIILNANAVQAP